MRPRTRIIKRARTKTLGETSFGWGPSQDASQRQDNRGFQPLYIWTPYEALQTSNINLTRERFQGAAPVENNSWTRNTQVRLCKAMSFRLKFRPRRHRGDFRSDFSQAAEWCVAKLGKRTLDMGHLSKEKRHYIPAQWLISNGIPCCNPYRHWQ